MAAAKNPQTIENLFSQLGKQYAVEMPEGLTVLDHLILAVLQEGTSFQQALDTYRTLRNGFINFNEMRVSHPKEIDELLGDLPNRSQKSRRILDVLRFVFETMYGFDLETMRKKPLKQAQKQLSKIVGGNSNFVVAAVVQRALGGHSLPIDEPMAEVLRQLDLAEPDDTIDTIRGSLEHTISKAKGVEFCLLISGLAAESPKVRDAWIQTVLGKKKETKSEKAPKTKGAKVKVASPPAEGEAVESKAKAKTTTKTTTEKKSKSVKGESGGRKSSRIAKDSG